MLPTVLDVSLGGCLTRNLLRSKIDMVFSSVSQRDNRKGRIHMTRFLKYWQALPVGNRVGAALSLAVVVACFIVAGFQIHDLVTGGREAAPEPAPSTAASRGIDFFSFHPWR
jgi:hypothetical protein